MSLEGFDVSEHNGTPTSFAGQSFMFARASFGMTPDVRYDAHVAAARAAGVIVGAYCFGVGFDGAQQAATFLRIARGADLLALDLETNDGGQSMTLSQARAFVNAIHAAKRRVGLYHSASGYPNVGQDWNWVAQWGTVAPVIGWRFWQYQGSPLDRDRFAGTLADLRRLAGIPDPAPREAPMRWDPTLPTNQLVDLANGVALYDEAGHLLVRVSSDGAGRWSPFAIDATQRAVEVSIGGVRQLVAVKIADCHNLRPRDAHRVAVSVAVLVDDQPSGPPTTTPAVLV